MPTDRVGADESCRVQHFSELRRERQGAGNCPAEDSAFLLDPRHAAVEFVLEFGEVAAEVLGEVGETALLVFRGQQRLVGDVL